MNPDTRVHISPSVYARAFGDELVLLDFGRGEYYALDEIGAVVWRKLEAHQSLGEIADAVVACHEVSREQAFSDIIDLVTHMRDQALVQIEEPAITR